MRLVSYSEMKEATSILELALRKFKLGDVAENCTNCICHVPIACLLIVS